MAAIFAPSVFGVDVLDVFEQGAPRYFLVGLLEDL
jgi:hypothetical protein